MDDNEVDEDNKREKRVVIDKETGKSKEVDIYDRGEGKKKDPEKLKAIFSSTLEQSIIPQNISKNIINKNVQSQTLKHQRKIMKLNMCMAIELLIAARICNYISLIG